MSLQEKAERRSGSADDEITRGEERRGEERAED